MTTDFSTIVSGGHLSGDFTFPYARSMRGRTRPHKGIDLAVVNDTGVFSPPVAATVVKVGNDTGDYGWGNYVVLQMTMPDGATVYTIYGHLSSIAINPGTNQPYVKDDPVAPLTKIALSGNSGNAGTAANPETYRYHLHYEERLGSAGGTWNTAIPVEPTLNWFNLTSGQCGVSYTDGGPVIPGQQSTAAVTYRKTYDAPTNATILLFSNGVTYTYNKNFQEWYIPKSDGTFITTTREIYGTPVGANGPVINPTYGEWQQLSFDTRGAVIANQGVSSKVSVALVGGATASNPFLDSATAQAFALAEATGGAIPNALVAPQALDVAIGNTAAFTIYTSCTTTLDQLIKLSLPGNCTNKYVCKGDSLVSFDANGEVTVTIPAGQDHVTVTLVDAANTSSADVLSLTASIVDPNAAPGSTPVPSNTLAVTFASPNPNADTPPPTPGGASYTYTGDHKPAEYTDEVAAGTPIDPGWKWGTIINMQVGKTHQATDAGGNPYLAIDTYLYTHYKCDEAGNFVPGDSDPNRNDYNLQGTSGNDSIDVGGGNNNIDATQGGNDTLIGGDGNNGFGAGAGNNTITVGNGTNYIMAGDGANTITTGNGGNTINAGNGKNTITSGNGNSYIKAGNGANLIAGGGGQDVILAGNGSNQIYAGSKVDLATALAQQKTLVATNQKGDLIAVGNGNNTIIGGSGNDAIFTGSGNNTIVCGPGAVTVAGGMTISGVPDANAGASANVSANWSLTQTGTSWPYHYTCTGFAMNSTPFTAPASYFGTYDTNGKPAGSSNDTIFGGTGNSVYWLSNGDNWLDAGGGNDLILAGVGHSTIFGGIGNDTIFGAGGHNYINLESGNDFVLLEGGNNTVIGGSGNDTIWSGDDGTNFGINWADSGAASNNYIYGGSGKTCIYGSAGNDTLIGGTGDASIYGGNGNEYIVGGDGNVSIVGGNGNDTIYAGGAGRDTIFAGDGNNTIFGGDGINYITGGNGNDLISAGDGGTVGDETKVWAGSGSSMIYGGAGVDKIYGGSGTDTLIAGSGTCTLQGGSGTELLYSSIGNATLIAGSGSDTLYGGSGTDLLQGNSSSSSTTLFVAGSGNETIIGGSGSNTYEFDAGFGNVELMAASSSDTLRFGAGITASALTVSATTGSNGGGALLIQTGDGGQLTLDGGLNGAISLFSLAGGTLSLDQLLANANCVDSTVADANGNTTVFGGSGNSTLAGGVTGNNTFYVNGSGNTINVVNSSDVINAQAGTAGNTVEAGVDYVLPANVQNLTGIGSADITLTGNNQGDTITANNGNDTLIGGAGNDTLIGGAGLDTFSMSYGMGQDTVSDASAQGAIIKLQPDVTSDALLATRQGDDLLLQIDTNDSLLIQGYYANPQTSWTIRDANGDTTPQAILDAMPLLSKVDVLEKLFVNQTKAGIISGYLARGYTGQSDGAYHWTNMSGSTAGVTAFNTVTDLTFTTTQYDTYGHTVSSSVTTSAWDNVWANYDIPVVLQSAVRIGIIDISTDAPVVYADTGTSQTSQGTQWLQTSWTSTPIQTTYGYPQAYGSLTYIYEGGTSSFSQTTGLGALIGWQDTSVMQTTTEYLARGTIANVLDLPGGLQTGGAFPQAVEATSYSTQITSNVERITLGNTDQTVYADSLTVVNSTSGNDIIYNAGFAYGGNGNDTMIGGNIMVAGSGLDQIYAGSGAATIQIDPNVVSRDLIGGAGSDSTQFIDSFYRAMGINQWQDRYRYGAPGMYVTSCSDAMYGISDEQGIMEYFQGWGLTFQELLGKGWIKSLDLLPVLLQLNESLTQGLIPSSCYATSNTPVVTLSANGYQALAPYFSDGVLPGHTVAFGQGVTASDLRLTWGETTGSISGLSSDPQLRYTTLNISWGTGNQNIQVMIPHSDDPLGSGVSQFTFANPGGTTTTISMADMIAMAPAAPTFDPQVFQYRQGMGAVMLDAGYVSIAFGSGITAGSTQFMLNGTDLLITDGVQGDCILVQGFAANGATGNYSIGQFQFADGSQGSYVNDGQGNATLNAYDTNGRLTGDFWQYADGSYGNDTCNADGSSSGTAYNADSSYASYVNDGQGNVTTTSFNAAGTRLNDNWSKADGSHGTDTFDAIGSIMSSTIYGTTSNDVISGTAATNLLNGGAGDDTLTGGAGNNTLIGGAGNDTYIINAGGGIDTIIDDFTGTENNTIIFGAGVDPASIRLFQGSLGIDLGNGTVVHIQGVDYNDIANTCSIQSFRFANGTELTAQQLVARGFDSAGSAGADHLSGTNVTDRMYGGAGDDVLSGGAGDDALTGGTGNDTLIGGAGNDSYLFNIGDGADTIQDDINVAAGGTEINTLVLGAGITAAMITPVIDADGNVTLNFGNGDSVLINRIGNLSVQYIQFADDSVVPTESLLNAAPVAVADAVITGEDNAQTAIAVASLLANDTDPNAGDTVRMAGFDAVTAQGNVVAQDGNGNLVLGIGNKYQTLGAGQTAADSFSYTISDTAGMTSTATVNVTITGSNDAPMLVNPLVAQNIAQGQQYQYTVPAETFADPDSIPGDTLTLSATLADGSALPSWLTFDAATRTFSGMAGDPGSLNLRVTATDAAGASVAAMFNLGIAYTSTPGQTVAGTTVNNALTGTGGDDTLDGLAGSDTMTGGLGNDTYIVDNTSDKVIENAYQGIDTVQSTVTYTLAANVENLVLQGTSSLAGYGNALNNVITCNSGGNTLDGGLGADTMIGGLGNDVYVVDNACDIVAENLGEGTDLVRSSIDWTLLTNIENLTLTGDSAITGTGNELNNAVTGNARNNLLYGLDGNDTLDGGVGADTLVGGRGDDVHIVDSANDVVSENLNEGTDRVNASIDYTLGANLENLNLTGATAITGTGNELVNYLNGNALDNVLYGMGGNDVLNGCAGADTMVGGLGNDQYHVGNIGDVVIENPGEGLDWVSASIDYTLGANVEGLGLTGTTAINGTGNELDNYLNGNAANNVLYGLGGNDGLDGFAGADTMVGGLGNDVYTVDNSGDVVIENLGEGTDRVNAAIDGYTLGANVENLTLAGAAITGTGNELNNVLKGNALDNVLYGMAGNDALHGLAGADTLIGGLGDDTYTVENSGDVVIENMGEGTDLVQISVDYTLSANIENLTLTGSAITGVGNDQDNILSDNSANNYLAGMGGNDTLHAYAGNDILQGGTGNDTLIDTAGANLFDGGTGADTLTGNSGNELFIGGAGNDTIATGTGADILAFNRGDGADVVSGGIGTDNTISLGGGINYADIALSKVGSNLVFEVGGGDQITLSNWYDTSANRKCIVDLQVMADAMAAFNPASTDPLLNKAVQNFDFTAIANAFDQARGTNATFLHWSATNSLLAAHLSSGDTAALGGDLAYYYGSQGSLSGMNVSAVQSTLSDSQFATAPQTLNPWPTLNTGTAQIR